MYCVHCGVPYGDDANFCSNCGKELSLSPPEEVVESRNDESQSEIRVHHPWMPVQQQPQEQVKEESQHEAQGQEQGEVPKALKSILNRVQGWSTKKKVLWGIVAFFLLMICAAVIAGEPVEEDGLGNNIQTSIPTDEDRLAGKHCMREFQTNSKAFIQAEMLGPISTKWFGFDPSTLEMTDYKIAPLDHELTDLFEQEYNAYGGVWPGQKKHAAIAEFTANHVDRGKSRYTAVFWARHDDCEIVLLDMARAR